MPKSKNKRKNAGKKKSSGVPVVDVAAAAAGSSESAAPKVGPVKYVGQVRQEARRVVWPGWPEVWIIVDWALANIVQFVLGLGA